MPADLDPIAARLTAARRDAGLTLDQLAARTGIAKSYLSRLERGVSEPGLHVLRRWARGFGLDVGLRRREEGA